MEGMTDKKKLTIGMLAIVTLIKKKKKKKVLIMIKKKEEEILFSKLISASFSQSVTK